MVKKYRLKKSSVVQGVKEKEPAGKGGGGGRDGDRFTWRVRFPQSDWEPRWLWTPHFSQPP